MTDFICIFFAVAGLISSSSGLRCWTCHNANSPGECIEFGQSVMCSSHDDVCQTELRYSSGWAAAPTLRTGCKDKFACGVNFNQNPRKAWRPTQCNSGKFNSVCRCCCRGDNCNEKNLLCESAGEANLPEPFQNLLCDERPMPAENGGVKCQISRYPGSQCRYTCKEGYIPLGNTITTCTIVNNKAEWNLDAPICQKQYICDIPEAPIGGKIICTGHGQLGTICRFSCGERLQVEGAAAITCVMRASGPEWTDAAPTCETARCRDLGNLRYGRVSCTGNNNELGTLCGFECTGDYLLLPADRVNSECVWFEGEAIWTNRLPCCNTIICPPTAKKDIVIAIDSSSSIKGHEWGRMRTFVTHVIKKFDVSSDNVQVAVFRFNREVDTKSQISFGDYNNTKDLVDAIESLPKDGSGTYIGKALRHVRDNILTHNNRPTAGDMVWVLTDGRSSDDFDDVAKELREQGVQIIVLGVSRKGEKEFLNQLNRMTGDRQLVMEVSDVIDSFADDLVQLVTSKICEVSCEE